VLLPQVNMILTAVVQGMRKEEASPDVRLAATRALSNAVEFAAHNFDNESERNFIMQVSAAPSVGSSVGTPPRRLPARGSSAAWPLALPGQQFLCTGDALMRGRTCHASSQHSTRGMQQDRLPRCTA
jgi:hypothetical protein